MRNNQLLSATYSFVLPSNRLKANGYKSGVFWLTGLSGSGKSNLAYALELELHKMGINTYLLDGGNLRTRLNSDLDFTDQDRTENIRRIAELSNKEYQLGNTYKNSMSISFDIFWNIVDGLKLGIKYVYGKRWNKDGSTGKASRISTLFYYDF